MRDYGKVAPQFWTGRTGKALRAAGPEVQVVALYLLTCPSANMIGLYYLPIPTLAHETGMTIEGASKGLRRASEAGFCTYDEEAEVVWVHEMARFQIGATVSRKDKRHPGIVRMLATAPKSCLLNAFHAHYAEAFALPALTSGSPLEGASKPLPSPSEAREQEQDQDQEYVPPLPPPRGAREADPARQPPREVADAATETPAERIAHRWPAFCAEVTGVPGRFRPAIDSHAILELLATYDEARIWQLARVMLLTPSLAGKVRNPRLLLELAPEIERWLRTHGDEADAEAFGTRGARHPPSPRASPLARGVWRDACEHTPRCATPSQCALLQARATRGAA